MMKRMILAGKTTAVMVACCGLAAGALAQAPASRVEPVTETMHGQSVVDPYRWLEGDNSNPQRMGAMTPEVAEWTDAQNARTREVLDGLPGRRELEDRLRPLMQIGSVSAPAMARGRYFYTRREGTQSQPIVFVRERFDGPARELLDPAKIDPTGLTALGGMWPSQCGKLLAFGLYRAGDENTTIHVLDVATGQWLADSVAGKAGSVDWLPDSSGFFYRNLEDVNDPYSGQIMFHRLGTHQREDRRLFRQFTREQNEKLATTWGPGASISRDARWMLLAYWTGTSSNDLWVIDLDRWFRTGEFVKREIASGLDATFFGPVLGDTLYLRTNLDASNGTVFAVDLNNPARENWRVFIPERKDAVLEGVSLARGVLVASYTQRATSRFRLFDASGKDLGELRLPQEIGSAGISTDEDRTEAFVSFTSFNYPTTIFRVDLAQPAAEPAVWERPDVPVDPSLVEVKQVTYSSKDGTPVTMFVVHKKGVELNGRNPTLLTGYGGFNISMDPFFAATLFPWFEAGGVFAMPNLRGGGEYGKAWHEGGMLSRKQNVFDDFYGAAEWLIENRYTSPDRLAITGGSNGGLLTGAAVTQRPELFGAVVIDVPLLDMLRYQHFLMARYWVPEYGDADRSAEEFAFLRAYSPYHNIRQGTRYPAVFLTAGENDTRVHPMHARKMAAALQAATTSDPKEKPVLLWVDRDAGHGAGKPLELRIRDLVDERMFIMWQLGMLPGRSVSLGISGMTCELCASEVRDAIGKLPGVRSVEVNVEGASAVVGLDSGATIDAASVAQALSGTKFKVTAK